jgi:glutamate/tyrosine decarboxylase-like PLP-dependent enzyme
MGDLNLKNLIMNKQLKKDLETLEQLLQLTLDEGLDYLGSINELPTTVRFDDPGITKLQEEGRGGMPALTEFKQRFRELMVASAGPRYWGFVTGGTTPAAIMGDMLATFFDQNTQTHGGEGDISGIVEKETVELLLDLFGLPHEYLGGFVTGATMSNFTCLGVARQWVGHQLGKDLAKDGISEIVPVLSATPHSSAIKALAMLGMGSRNLHRITTIDETREAIDIAALEEKIKTLNDRPFILITSGGTVNTVDYDDFQAIARLKGKYRFWWHIDAAFGGFAALSSEHAHLLAGWEEADSITIDGHKWLNVPYESAFFFVKEEHRYRQVETFQNSNAPYLGDPMEQFNYLNFLPENSRRFKALPAWFTLKAYGKAGYREIVERNIRLARQLGAFIAASDEFELLAPVRLNTVCFSLRDERDDQKVRAFLTALNAGGKVFMTPTFYRGRAGIRAALVNWRTTEADVQMVKEEMELVFHRLATMSF